MRKEKMIQKINSMDAADKKCTEAKKKIAKLMTSYRTGKNKISFFDFDIEAGLGSNQVYNLMDPTKSYSIDTLIKACHVIGIDITIGDVTIKNEKR